MIDKKHAWTGKLDWLNILNLMDFESISQISDFERNKAIQTVTDLYGSEFLLEVEPEELDSLVVHELKLLLKDKINLRSKQQKKAELEQKKMLKMSNPKKIKTYFYGIGDPEMIPKEIYKYMKKMRDDEDDEDDDSANDNEDNTSYHL